MLGLSCGTQDLLSCHVQTLHCGMWDLVPRPGIEPGTPALGVWSLSHWTTREVPAQALLKQETMVENVLLCAIVVSFHEVQLI